MGQPSSITANASPASLSTLRRIANAVDSFVFQHDARKAPMRFISVEASSTLSVLVLFGS
jgi:hypothetical protein